MLIFELLQHNLFFALRVERNSFPKALPKNELLENFKKMKKGDMLAREILIKHNLRLVAHVVNKYYSNENDYEDLISIGSIGLIKAVNNFNYEKQIKFATYAVRCIENEILMFFRHQKKFAGDRYIEDIKNKVDIENTNNLYTTLAKKMNIEMLIELKSDARIVHEIINSCLNARERTIIVKRFGLFGQKTLTQMETAKILKISRSYVSRIEKRALNILKFEFNRRMQKDSKKYVEI